MPGAGGEERRIETVLERALSAWVGGVRVRARGVLVATSLATAAAIAYTAFGLGINASHTALLSENLPFWRAYTAFAEVFPIVDEAIFVVVDAETPTRARDATDVLAERLALRTDRFEDIYVPGGGEFFERHALLYLSEEELYDLADHLAAVQPMLAELARDRSLPGLVRVLDSAVEHAEDDPTTAENLAAVFDSVSRAAQAVLEGQPRPVSWTEMLLERKLPGDSARRLIVAYPHLDYAQWLPAGEAIRTIRKEAAALDLDAEHGARVRVTGNVALNYEEMLLVARGAVAAIAGSLVLVAVILWFALRSRRLVASVLVTLLVGLVWTAAFATFAVGELNVISIAFAVLFIGLGVDFGIHFAMRYAELLEAGEGAAYALSETAGTVGGSLVLCAVTTAISFFVFVPTDYRAVGQLGIISGTGLPISLFCSLTVLPALLAVGDASAARPRRAAPRWFTEALIPLAVRNAVAVRIVAGVLAVVSILLLPRVGFDINVARIRDPSAESVQTFEELLADSENSPWTIDLIEPDLAAAEATADQLEGLAVVDRAVTLADYIPQNQEEKREILADLAFFVPAPATYTTKKRAPSVSDQIGAVRALRQLLEVPFLVGGSSSRSESAQRARATLDRFLARLETIEDKGPALEGFETSLLGALPDQLQTLWHALDPDIVDYDELPRDLVRRMQAPDGRARVEVTPSEDLGDDVALARFVDTVRAERPQATGSAVSVLEWARATSRSFRQALVTAAIAVTLVVWLLWRSLRDLVLVLTPLLLAALLTGGTAAALGIDFNFVNIIVLPLLLGIGVDSGIHLVHRHRVAEQQHLHLSAARELLTTSTAQAVFFSAMTTMASFGSLALSSHRGIASLGQLLLLGVAITLVCNLVVLPALLVRRGRAEGEAPAERAGLS